MTEELRPGDVVEARLKTWPDGCYIHGPIREDSRGRLLLCGYYVPGITNDSSWSYVVIERAPRPSLYVNHPRGFPLCGDVARPVNAAGICIYMLKEGRPPYRWVTPNGNPASPGNRDLVLLVDGSTGRTVPEPEPEPEVRS